ncbi:TetR family transcriptional regulator [Bordetella genomosp. 9]|nr:TetR family transcriptional regulator [Bordetella genomosp. 9]
MQRRTQGRERVEGRRTGTARGRTAAPKAAGASAHGRPGRPEGANGNLREKILDAAESRFADLGYAGTTLRDVAEKAKVTQALISYYFGSKHGLYEAVFLRRGRKISDERMERLQALQEGKRRPAIRDIVRAFLEPTLALRRTAKGRAFIRLQARLHTEPPEISYKLRNEAYDASTRAYVEAIGRARPDLNARDVYWRVTLMVGAYMYAFSDTHRLEELAKGVCNPEDPQEIMDQITAFVVGGLEAAAPRS